MNDETALIIRASALDLTIPEAYRDPVLRNLALLEHYAAILEAVDLPERLEPAFEYRP